MMKINLLDLQRQSKIIKESLISKISMTIDNCDFISGDAVKELEASLQNFTNSENVITCGNGTDALQISLMGILSQPNSYVICPSFTFVSTAEVIPLTNAVPYFVDVEQDSFNIDISQIKEAAENISKIGGKLAAIISVDLYGRPCEYNEIKKIAKKYDCIHISDCAQSFGAKYKNSSVLSLADISTTSFFPTKPLGCYGDGGAIFTNNNDISAKLRSIAVHGKGSNKYDNVRVGLNSRLDTIQAHVLLEKMKLIDNEIAQRQNIAEKYIAQINNKNILPSMDNNLSSAWAQFTLTLESQKVRDNLRSYLEKSSIPSGIYYPAPISEQKPYQDFPKLECKNSKLLSETVLSLPMSPYMNQDEISFISDKLNLFFK